MKLRYVIIVVCALVCVLVFVSKKPNSNLQTTQKLGIQDSIILTSPSAQSVVRSPIHLSGKARGMWYFEASFPISVLDSNGKEIGHGHATAVSDWMTTGFVPFTADIEFSNPTGKTGTIILKKDNPSGDSSRDDSLSVPVVFTAQ